MTSCDFQTISDSSPALVYDFYEIDKFFSDKKNESGDGVPEGNRVIPIYICNPLRYVHRKVMTLTPQQLEQQEVLKELHKIDEMNIELIKVAPRTKARQSRKTRLIPLTSIEIKTVKSKLSTQVPVDNEDEAMTTEDIPKEKEEDKPEEEDSMETGSEETSANIRSPSPSDCDEKPNFHCEKCDRSFYMKRALRRHMYAHK